ncbi:MAG TPA: PHP domain-containing protein [Gemmatimonadales bacterium]|nr:PHP domain-containing protein [Gemmatimonadales bacterium]
MDLAGPGVRPLTALADLHLHSTASDGTLPPEAVVARGAALGLAAVALTDHDTLAGLPAATAEGERLGVRVVGGCEFSVAAPWGEMHLLGYFLPPGDPDLEEFLVRQRADRERRAGEMAGRLRRHGLPVSDEAVRRVAGTGALGRPHVARVLLEAGVVGTMDEAFERWLRRGRPGFVAKTLPTLSVVAGLVHAAGGVVSAAHLKERGTRATLAQFQSEGLDALEVRHPAHSPDLEARLLDLARGLRLGISGGSDWHGEIAHGSHGALGASAVPLDWLDALEARRPA